MDTINFNDAEGLEDKVFVDVRTPLEFSRDHIAGAINIPVLSDEQRAIVGTIYKKENREKAIDIGTSFFNEKLPKIKSILEGYKGRKVIAYCWRGGMRSGAFVTYLRSHGIDIIQLEGGYKTFRRYVRESLYGFDIKPELFCIYGMTGTGKTDIIKTLEPISIDLEGLASHRSSIFGHIGLSPRTQKMFENLMLSELRRIDELSYVFVEGESRKIGNICLPDKFFKAMISGNAIKVFSSMPARVKRIVDEYFDSDEKINEIEKVLESSVLINKLGRKNITFLKSCLKAQDYEPLVEVLLEKYYDPMYAHSQKRLKGAVEIDSENIDDAARMIKKYADNCCLKKKSCNKT